MEELKAGVPVNTEDLNVGDRPEQAGNKQKRLTRIAFASFIGTAIEYYDFYIYATAAALVFSAVYFPSESEAAALFASYGTFAVAYFARPLGGILFGHFGDRVGRKKMLVASLLLMGVGTFLIGLIPSYSSIGVAAPMLLVTLRLLQGIGFGGEWGGAVLMAAEHAPKEKRAFYTSWVQMGIPVGFLASSLAFLLVGALVSVDQFISWGWRIPFLASIFLVFVGLYVRTSIAETPEFERAVVAEGRARVPLVEVLRDHWGAVVLATLPAALAGGIFSLLLVFMVRHGTAVLGLSSSTMMVCNIIATLFLMVGIPLAARAADKWGRYRVTIVGSIGLGVWSFPMFGLINTGDPVLVTLALAVAMVALSLLHGPLAAVVSEHFQPRVRYTGAALSYNLSSLLGSALTPIVTTWLFVETGSTEGVSAYVLGMAIVSVIALMVLSRSKAAAASSAAAKDQKEPGERK